MLSQSAWPVVAVQAPIEGAVVPSESVAVHRFFGRGGLRRLLGHVHTHSRFRPGSHLDVVGGDRCGAGNPAPDSFDRLVAQEGMANLSKD